MKRLGFDTFELVFDLAYVIVGTSVLFTFTTLPLFATLYLFNPAEMVGIIALEALLLFPALAATFGVFQRFSNEGDASVVRNYFRAWWRSLKRALILGVGTVAILLGLLIEFTYLWTTQSGALIAPILVVSALAVATFALYSLAINASQPDAALKTILKAAVYVPIRHPFFLVFSWLVLVALAALTVSFPAVALGLAVAPALYLIWSNVGYSLNASIASLTRLDAAKQGSRSAIAHWGDMLRPARKPAATVKSLTTVTS